MVSSVIQLSEHTGIKDQDYGIKHIQDRGKLMGKTLVTFLQWFSKTRDNFGAPLGAWGRMGFLSGKQSICNAGDPEDMSSVSGSGRPPGGGSGNLLQYSGLINSMGRGAWWATVRRVAKSRTRLSDWVWHGTWCSGQVALSCATVVYNI